MICRIILKNSIGREIRSMFVEAGDSTDETAIHASLTDALHWFVDDIIITVGDSIVIEEVI